MINYVNNVSFKGIYKYSMPSLDALEYGNEKNALTDFALVALPFATNMSVEEPKIAQDGKSILFSIDDKNDQIFEKTFYSILDNCNQKFNIDLAKKVYLEKVDREEYDKGAKL